MQEGTSSIPFPRSVSHRSDQADPDTSSSALILAENQTVIGKLPSLLAHLSAREREIVLSHGRRKVYYKGATLFNQGTPHDGIYLIESGRIRVFYISPSGREITLAYWYPGNFVGGPEVFGTGLHSWTGVAASNSSAVWLPGKQLKALITEIPALAIGIIEGLAFKGKCYSTMAQMLGTRSATERLVHLLLHLTDTYGIPDEAGIFIGAAFTHADFAHMVGATRQWVTIFLKRLQNDGIIQCRKSQIVVRDRTALAAMQNVQT
ncbi:MAG: Crp/Fnr family transcriptional regulator [Ferrovibrio sp.]|uniref:Crp/Fnr family transcriptional regulator n=1 Tax=Ferrovibrio sp. TaxID=1917215 RepID=UPI00391CCD07